MITMIIVLWWLSGFVPSIIYTKLVDGRVVVRDLIIFTWVGFLGVILWPFMLLDYIEITEVKRFWDKKIF